MNGNNFSVRENLQWKFLKRHIPKVILGEIIDGSFFKSAIAASGKPQFATK